jgi:toxin YoeB
MKVVTYHSQVLADLEWWRDHHPAMGRRVVEAIEETAVTPEAGHGRPKRLSALPNLWSRRVTKKHRIYYLLLCEELRFLSCRGHDLPQHMYDAMRAQETV